MVDLRGPVGYEETEPGGDLTESAMDGATQRMLSELRQQVDQLRQENDQLRHQIAQLRDQNCQLQEQLEQAQQTAARQAAPFRRRDSQKVPQADKKRPGRKPGHPAAYRAVPPHVDATVEVPLTCCPHCAGAVQDVVPIEQYIVELPPVRPLVTRLLTHRGVCPVCGNVASTHPLQTSTATGAAAVQLGPNARAWALALNKQYGLTLRKTCRILAGLVGLTLSPGGLAQAAQRAAVRLQDRFDQLVDEVRSAAAVFVDETSWYVGAPGHWLWTFTTVDATVYHVDQSRGRQVVLDMLGCDFEGILVSDCLASYENVPYRTHKCIAHHQRAIAKARDRPDTVDESYLNEWKRLFTMVSVVWRYRVVLGEAEFARQRDHLVRWLDRLLAQECSQPGDLAIQQRIGTRRDVGLSCLFDPAAEPTNNRAERSLRDVGVIARKLSCGNKTAAGAHAWEVLTSLAVTCQQRGHDFVSWLASCLPIGAGVIPIPQPTPGR
jgi:transposase